MRTEGEDYETYMAKRRRALRTDGQKPARYKLHVESADGALVAYRLFDTAAYGDASGLLCSVKRGGSLTKFWAGFESAWGLRIMRPAQGQVRERQFYELAVVDEEAFSARSERERDKHEAES